SPVEGETSGRSSGRSRTGRGRAVARKDQADQGKAARPEPDPVLDDTSGDEDVEPAESADGQAPALKEVFPIVGVGASAGGLEAFRALLTNLPPKPGM